MVVEAHLQDCALGTNNKTNRSKNKIRLNTNMPSKFIASNLSKMPDMVVYFFYFLNKG
jgi:hypothetical protein